MEIFLILLPYTQRIAPRPFTRRRPEPSRRPDSQHSLAGTRKTRTTEGPRANLTALGGI